MWRFGWTASARPVWDGGAETAGRRSGDALPPRLGAGSPVRSGKPPTPPSRCGDGALQTMDCWPGSRHSARFSGPQNVYGGLPEKPPIRSWRKEGRGIIAALAFLMTYHFVACQAFFSGDCQNFGPFQQGRRIRKKIPRRKNRVLPGACSRVRRGGKRKFPPGGPAGTGGERRYRGCCTAGSQMPLCGTCVKLFFPRGVNKTVRPQKTACGLAPEGASSLDVPGEAKRGRP